MKRLIAVSLMVAGALAIAGCQSAAAQRERWETADALEDQLVDNADSARDLSVHHIEQAHQAELNRLQNVLIVQNVRAGNDVQKVGQNYIDFFTAIRDLDGKTAAEYKKAETLRDEARALAKGYKAISDMADGELEISKAASARATQAAIDLVSASYAEWQRLNPTPLPDPKPSEPVIIVERPEAPEEPPATPVPTPTPAPAPTSTPTGS